MSAISSAAAAMLHLTLDTSSAAAGEVRDRLDALARQAPASDNDSVAPLLAHGRLLHDLLPAVDDTLKAMRAVPRKPEQDALRSMILVRQLASRTSARQFRRVLYGTSLLLVGFLVYLGLRLRSRAKTLQRRAAFEHVIAGISMRFINAQPQNVDAEIERALDDMARKLAGREEELRIANEHLEELASLDGLTGLANRRGFDRQLEQEWRRAGEINEPVALMMIDIDHFKLYNDRYGHVSGDTCLRSVGETLSLVTLENAVLVARYGGEEFALLLPGLDLSRIASLAEEARRSIEDLFITHAEAPCGYVTISIGVESMVPRADQTAADLVEAADRALYAAKRRGRNRVDANVPTLVSTTEPEPRIRYETPPLVA